VCAFKSSSQKKVCYFNMLRFVLSLKCQNQELMAHVIAAWLLGGGLRQSKYVHGFIGTNANGVFKLGREFAIDGDSGPAIVKDLCM